FRWGPAMTRRFQVGDRVRVCYPPSKWHGTAGEIVHVDVAHRATGTPPTRWGKGERIYRLDTFPPDCFVAGRFLRPIHDGDEKLSWSDERVVWKPRAIA